MAESRQSLTSLRSSGAIRLVLVIVVAAVEAAAHRAAAEVDMDAALHAVAGYRHGDERKALFAVEQLVRQAASLGGDDARGVRRNLADRMASLLNSKEATAAAKAFLCGQLAAIGAESHAPALVALLAEKELAPAALSALGQIPGPSVDRILRDAAGTLKGDLRIGAVNALGQRRDAAPTGLLAAMLSDADEALACAAASALGKIGSEAALTELRKSLASPQGRLRAEVAYACLRCADHLLAEKKDELAASVYAQLGGPGERPEVRMAALRGRVRSDPGKAAIAVCEALLSGDSALENMAIQLVSEVSDSAATEQFATCLGKASAPVQALLVGVLAVRQDTAARAAVEAAASSSDEAVRVAALKALGTCGNGASVKILLDRALAGASTTEGQAARQSLIRLRGKDVNQVLAGAIPRQDARAKTELIRILAARNAKDAIADLEKAAEDPDATVRKKSATRSASRTRCSWRSRRCGARRWSLSFRAGTAS